MKPFLKAIIFLAILTILEFLLRKGFIGFLIPFSLPQSFTLLFLFTLFAVFSWLITKWFCKKDKTTFHDLGISFDTRNRFEFYYGFLVGLGLWAIVSLTQSVLAGFSWILRPDINFLNIIMAKSSYLLLTWGLNFIQGAIHSPDLRTVLGQIIP